MLAGALNRHLSKLCIRLVRAHPGRWTLHPRWALRFPIHILLRRSLVPRQNFCARPADSSTRPQGAHEKFGVWGGDKLGRTFMKLVLYVYTVCTFIISLHFYKSCSYTARRKLGSGGLSLGHAPNLRIGPASGERNNWSSLID